MAEIEVIKMTEKNLIICAKGVEKIIQLSGEQQEVIQALLRHEWQIHTRVFWEIIGEALEQNDAFGRETLDHWEKVCRVVNPLLFPKSIQ